MNRRPNRVYLIPDSNSATPKTYGIHGLTPGLKTFFLCRCVMIVFIVSIVCRLVNDEIPNRV